MSNWPTRQELNLDEKRIVELTDSDAVPQVIDESLVTAMRERAVGVVEGYCAAADYIVPFVSPPPLVRTWAAAVWRYFLFEHRPQMAMPETVANSYAMAIKSLEKVAAKQMPLAAPQQQSSLPPSQSAGGLVENVERAFGRGRDGLG